MNWNSYADGNGNGNGSGVSLKKLPVLVLSKIFNIVPSQWPRVTECWLITFLFKVGSAIGWTVLTAAFIARFGITFLPTLFILNSILIIGSTFFFEQLILRIKREVLMIIMILCGAICLFLASFLYDKSYVAFFSLIIFAESVFLAQFNVFIPILVGDRFTPLESPKTFPFIESAETVGGMIGGLAVGIFASKLPTPIFLYIWIAFLACVILVFVITSYVTIRLPPLPFRVSGSSVREKAKDQFKLIFRGIKQIPFLKSIVLIILLQWMFLNILDFQYTKSIEQTVTRKKEATIAIQVAPEKTEKTMMASVLTLPPAAPPAENGSVVPNGGNRSLTKAEEQVLTEKLGALKGLFYLGAVVSQALLASRLITSLGTVGSLLLHPIIMLLSLVGMFLKFGFLSSVIAKLSFEVTNVVHKNAYFTSHYAFPKNIRDQAAEFLEGMVKPMGTIVGMLFVVAFQIFFVGKNLSMWVHLVMFAIMAVILLITMRLQPKYTKLSHDQLFSSLPYPEKLNAIEVLAQRGHPNASLILSQKLTMISGDSSPESHIVRSKLLCVLGQRRDYQALPEILEALEDENADIRLEASQALMHFHDLGEKFYAHAFSRHRTIESLKNIFKNETSSSVRCAIMKVFSLLRQPDIVSFLLDILRENKDGVRKDCVHTLGLFKDPNVAYYIKPYLDDESPAVRANAIVALWQFPKYHNMLREKINTMLSDPDPTIMKSGIFVVGEIGLPKEHTLFHLLHHGDNEVKIEAAYALTKFGDPIGFNILLHHFLPMPNAEFESFRRFLHGLKPVPENMVKHVLVNTISEQLNWMMEEYGERPLTSFDPNVLNKLQRLYKLMDQYEELYALETALKKQEVVALALT